MIQKQTILMIHPHFTIYGGAGKLTLEFAKRLSHKYNVYVIALKIDPEYIKSYPEIQFIDLHGLISSSFKFWIFLPYWRHKLFKVFNNLISKDNDIIFSGVFPANWLSFGYKSKYKYKRYWYCHEPSAFIHIPKWRNAIDNPIKKTIAILFSPLFSLIDKLIARSYDQIFCNSKFTSDFITQIYKQKSIVIYPGVDTSKLKPVDLTLKKNFILSVGRLTKFKNFDILIHAFSKIKDTKIKLYIVGNGEEKGNLISQIKKYDLSKRISIKTKVDDKKLLDYFSKAKLFVLCSKNEPFGIVPIEAMAAGTPVIVDDSGGLKETVLNNRTGKIIDLNEDSLAKTLDTLLPDQNILQTMSKQAQLQAQKFDWQVSVNNLLQYL